MGTDNIFHKRKAKSNEHLQRGKPKRQPYDRVLIVCEGNKSEPFYFESLIDDFRLSSANVKIFGKECNSSPDKVLEYDAPRKLDQQLR